MTAVDVHAHSVPPAVEQAVTDDPVRFGVWPDWFERTGTRLRIGSRLLRPLFPAMCCVGVERRAAMEETGVTHQVLSVWPDLFGYGLPVGPAEEWHGLLNSALAELAESDDAYSWLCAVSLQDPDLAADEVVQSLDRGAVGVIIGSHVNGAGLEEPRFAPFWAVVAERDVPVLIHPTEPAADPRSDPYNLRAVTGYTSETTACLSRIVLSGLLDRVDIKLISCHGGGFLPYQVGRLDRAHHLLRSLGATCENRPSTYLDRLYYDTITHSAESLRFLINRVGEDRVLLGSDFPFAIGDPRPVASVEACLLDPTAEEKVRFRNAQALFNLELAPSTDDEMRS